MNSNHPILCFRYEEKQNEVLHWKTKSHKERNIDCNGNDMGISDNYYAFTLLFKNNMSFKTFNNRMGSNPHQIK